MICTEVVIQLKDLLAKGTDSKSMDQARQLLSEGTDKLQKLAQDSQSKMGFKWETLQTFVKSAPGGQEVCLSHYFPRLQLIREL